MKQLRRYIIANLSSVFLSIFMPLFVIASMIFSIKLATYTAIIKLSVLDMFKLYLFVLPDILFYTLPISFFIAAVLAIFKLSNDNEIVVIFSLGISPSTLIKTLTVPASLLSLLLLINFYMLYPHTDNLSDNFLNKKRSEAKFNLSASEFGNSFGDWLLFISKQDKETKHYENVLLFNKKLEEEILIEAQEAQMVNTEGVLQLQLSHGEGYSYSKEKFSQINFEHMTIFNTMKSYQISYQNPLEYWLPKDISKLSYVDKWIELTSKKKKEAKMATNTLLALFPLVSLFLIISIGVVHARHQKSKIYLYIFVSVVLYYALAMSLHKVLHLYAIPVVLTAWLAGTYMLYRKTIAKRF